MVARDDEDNVMTAEAASVSERSDTSRALCRIALFGAEW